MRVLPLLAILVLLISGCAGGPKARVAVVYQGNSSVESVEASCLELSEGSTTSVLLSKLNRSGELTVFVVANGTWKLAGLSYRPAAGDIIGFRRNSAEPPLLYSYSQVCS